MTVYGPIYGRAVKTGIKGISGIQGKQVKLGEKNENFENSDVGDLVGKGKQYIKGNGEFGFIWKIGKGKNRGN